MMYLRLVSFLSTILLVFGGACLNDWNTNQPSSAWNQRLWSYSPKSAASRSSSSTLTFTSYNLQSSISSACKSNPQTQATYLKTDFFGSQEVAQGVDTRCNCNMPQIMADETGMSTRFVMTFPWRTGQYGIMAGSSQSIADTKYFLYTANSEQRALVAIKTYPSGLNGKALWFISTPLDYTVWAARQTQAQQLVKWVRDTIIAADSSASVVVTGDFNAANDDGFYNIMKGLFKNSWEVYHGSASGGATYPANWPSYRFDHIWYYTPSSVSASVQSVQVVTTLASDHLPLKATIKFTTSGSSSTPAPTAAPTKAATSAPTAAPTKAATSAPTKAATAAPTSGSSSSTCKVSVSYNSAGNNLVITNTGSKQVKNLKLSFSSTVPSNNWNLVAQGSNTFSFPDWAYESMKPGQAYTSSGFWTSGSAPTATVSSISC